MASEMGKTKDTGDKCYSSDDEVQARYQGSRFKDMGGGFCLNTR